MKRLATIGRFITIAVMIMMFAAPGAIGAQDEPVTTSDGTPVAAEAIWQASETVEPETETLEAETNPCEPQVVPEEDAASTASGSDGSEAVEAAECDASEPDDATGDDEATSSEDSGAETETEEASAEIEGDSTADVDDTAENNVENTAPPMQIAEDGGATPEADPPVPDITVPITVYNCTEDPGADDPATSGVCSGADGVEITYSIDGGSEGTVTTSGGGFASVDAPEGSQLYLEEAAPSGYYPLGNGAAWIDPVADGVSVTFVNILAEVQGRLQIAAGTCPTSGDERTEFKVIGPNTISVASTPACGPNGGAVFTITGGNLPAGGIQAVTDSNGEWRGFLPAGDYTITDDSGASETVTVVAEGITVVIVIDYYRPPTGQLVIEKWLCTEGAEEGTEIIIDGEGGGPSCNLSDGNLALQSVSEGTQVTFPLGDDGQTTMELPAGEYVLIDKDSGASTTIVVNAGEIRRAVLRTISLHGIVLVRHYVCDDPNAYLQDPTDPEYWEDECDPGGGVTVTLYDESGNPVASEKLSAAGVVVWDDLDPGIYSIGSDSGLCAVFVDDVDARGGFEVRAGDDTRVYAYTCVPPDGGDDDDGNGGGGSDNGDGSGGGVDDGKHGPPSGDGTAPPDEAGQVEDGEGDYEDELANVTQLPSTGEGFRAESDWLWLLVSVPAALMAAGIASRWGCGGRWFRFRR